jgi:DNA-binding NarL/FixJ family response regulator
VSRVLVVDHHPVTRCGLAQLIAEQPDLELVGESDRAEGLVALVTATQPDVVTLDVALPDADGLAVARELRDRFDDLGIVILTAAGADDVLLRALESGVSAFISKTAETHEIVAAVRHAAVSASFFTAVGLADALRRRQQAPSAAGLLSAREQQVLTLLVEGHSVPALAAALEISLSTAKTYVSRLYEKLGARNRAQALMAAVALGLQTSATPR